MWFKKGLTIFALSCALTVGVSAVNSAWAANKGYVTVKEIENNSPKIEIQMPQLKDHELQDKINAAIEQPINAAMTSYRELTDLFTDYASVEQIVPIIKRQIIERGKQNSYSFNGLQKNQQFFLTQEGLFLLFQPYEIAPYSEGSIYFFIPYVQLSNFNYSAILY